MTYVTGQPIIFVGCGQVSTLIIFFPLDTDYVLDIYRFKTVEGGQRCTGDPERLNTD